MPYRRPMSYFEKKMVDYLESCDDGEATVEDARRALGVYFYGGCADGEASGRIQWSDAGGPWRGVGDISMRETR